MEIINRTSYKNEQSTKLMLHVYVYIYIYIYFGVTGISSTVGYIVLAVILVGLEYIYIYMYVYIYILKIFCDFFSVNFSEEWIFPLQIPLIFLGASLIDKLGRRMILMVRLEKKFLKFRA